MRDDHGRMIKEINRNSHEKSVWKRIITVLACVVVFGTTYALILPAITMDAKKTMACTEETASGHVHLEACKAQDGETLTCGYSDYVIHTHDENCYDPDGNLICGLEEVKEHRHTEECYKEVPTQTEVEDRKISKELICSEPEVIYHEHNEKCFDENEMLICKEPQILKHQHTDQCFVTEKEEVKESQEPEEVEQTEEPEQQEPEAVKQPETEESEIEELAPSVEETKPEIKEPEKEEAENKETESKVPEAKSEEHENLEMKEEKKEEKETTEAQREHKMTHKGNDYTVHVTFGEEAQLPTGVELKVEEVKQGSTEYQDYYKQAEEALPEEQGLMFCRFFDVSFIADGKKVEPKASVDVEISYEDSVPREKGVEVNAIHFAEDGIEVIPAEVGENAKGEDTFTFTQDSFSVVGTAVSAINLSEGSYIFYRDGYALGYTGGSVGAVKVTVDENGYVYPEDSKTHPIKSITWRYDEEYLVNEFQEERLEYNKYLFLSDENIELSDTGQTIQARIINNTIRIAYINASLYPTGEKGYYLGFDDKNHTFKVGNTFASGDYLFGAKISNVEDSKIEKNDLEIEDTIKKQGVIRPKFNGVNKGGIIAYAWYRSDNGSDNWTKVERKRVTGDSYNIAEDGSWLNVPLDGGADKYYKVEIATIDGKQLSQTIESLPYHIPYFDQVQNGDFEEPVIPYDDSTTYNEHYQPLLPNGTAGMVWKTTASDGEIEFVSAAPGAFQEWSEKWHNCEKAAKGNQYVELNATMPGALYQDVLTIPGSTMYWRLAHRGRGTSSMEIGDTMSQDTMYVVIMSAKDAEDIVTQDQVDQIIKNPEKYSAKVTSITDDNKEWVYHTGDYEVPNGQYLTRYFFGAGETSFDQYGGEKNVPEYTVGNHLDDIHFSTELPPPAAGKVNLEIKKTIKGLNEDEAQQLLQKLIFSVGETQVSGNDFKNFKRNEDGSYTATYQEQINIGSESVVIKTVSEHLDTANVNGYIRSSTTVAVNSENQVSSNSATVKIQDQKTGVISFVNTYIPENVNISLLKTNDNITPEVLEGAVFSLEVSDGTDWNTVNKEIAVDANGIANINSLLYDKFYRLTETKAPDGYSKLTEHIYFKIQKENGTATIIPCDADGAQLTKWPNQVKVSSNEPLKLTIINSKKAMLPETGGSGTNRIYIAGIMMILTSGMIYGYRKKMRRGRRRHL